MLNYIGNPGSCTQNSGTLSYIEIEDILLDSSLGAVTTMDSTAAVMIATWGGNQWISYDNDQTLELKRTYANSICLGGYA
jgi:chitinase